MALSGLWIERQNAVSANPPDRPREIKAHELGLLSECVVAHASNQLDVSQVAIVDIENEAAQFDRARVEGQIAGHAIEIDVAPLHQQPASAGRELNLVPPSETFTYDPDGRDRQHCRDMLLSIVVLQPAVRERELFDQIIDGAGLARGARGGARPGRD